LPHENMMRERLPPTRMSVTHKAVIHTTPEQCPHCGKLPDDGRVKFFITVGYANPTILSATASVREGCPTVAINKQTERRPLELFIAMDESGSTLDGFADAWAIVTSMYWQSGGDLRVWVEKFKRQAFQPKGPTDEAAMGCATSLVDYVARWVEQEFGYA